MKINFKDSIKHIWWDLDDTLYSYNKEYHHKKNEALVRRYADLKKIDINDANNQYKNDIERYGSSSKLFREVFGFDNLYSQSILNTVNRMEFIKYDPSTIHVVNYLNTISVSQSIISNSTYDQIETTLEILKLNRNSFVNIISSSFEGFPKPSIDCFLKIIQISLLNPSEILYIGDREKVDIIPATQVGLKTCLVNNETNINIKSIANIRIDSIKNILEHF